MTSLNSSLYVAGTLPRAAPPSTKGPDDSSDSEEEGGEKEYAGEIEIPNLSEENDIDEVDVCC